MDNYDAQMMDLEGYTVTGDTVKQGTVESSDITLVFEYSKNVVPSPPRPKPQPIPHEEVAPQPAPQPRYRQGW